MGLQFMGLVVGVQWVSYVLFQVGLLRHCPEGLYLMMRLECTM